MSPRRWPRPPQMKAATREGAAALGADPIFDERIRRQSSGFGPDRKPAQPRSRRVDRQPGQFRRSRWFYLHELARLGLMERDRVRDLLDDCVYFAD
jgi:hypothetical protein